MLKPDKRKYLEKYYAKVNFLMVTLCPLGLIFFIKAAQYLIKFFSQPLLIIQMPLIMGLLIFYVVSSLLVLSLGLYCFFRFYLNKPTEKQVDRWLKEDIEKLSELATKKAGIEEDELMEEIATVPG